MNHSAEQQIPHSNGGGGGGSDLRNSYPQSKIKIKFKIQLKI